MGLFTALRIVHQTRFRIRLRYQASGAFNVSSLKRLLEVKPGIQRVEFGVHNPTIRICFAPDEYHADTVLALLFSIQEETFTALTPSNAVAQLPVHSIAKGVAAWVATPLLPLALRPWFTFFACWAVICAGAKQLLRRRVTSESMEAAAVLISIGRRDFTAAHVTNLLISLAEYIEHRIERQSDELLLSLVQPEAKKVWIRKDGVDIQVPAENVLRGMVVVAQAGETVAIDGRVLEGEALINEVSLTGEAVPVAKGRGDRVLSGTLVEEGRLHVYAEQVGRDRVAYRIAQYVESSLQSKSNTHLEAIRMADRLVPFSIGLASTGYLLSRDLSKVAAVLQADYSCALKLATPVAFKAALYKAGTHHILVKSASALEKLAQADVFIFDKTGTLTSGDMEVYCSFSLDPAWTSDEILRLAASIEEHYFHPIAQAVVKAAQSNGAIPHHFHHSEVEFIVAHGVMAYVDGKKVVIGSRHFLEDDEQICFAGHTAMIDEARQNGLTPLYIGYDGRLLGIICLKDELRPQSKTLLTRLKQMGVRKTIMLTGDRREKAEEIAAILGFDECYAELHPNEKAAIVEKQKQNGEHCVFIGDGINDAPALSLADVGIAMQRGADIARISADIALLSDDVLLIADVLALARQTLTRVKNNYHLTIGLNSIIMLLAVMGRLSPVATAVLHNGTTVGILLNAALGARIPQQKV